MSWIKSLGLILPALFGIVKEASKVVQSLVSAWREKKAAEKAKAEQAIRDQRDTIIRMIEDGVSKGENEKVKKYIAELNALDRSGSASGLPK